MSEGNLVDPDKVTPDDVWRMRKLLMTAWDWTAKDVQDLPLLDLIELYERTVWEGEK